MNIIQYDKCLFCQKKLRAKQQKRYGYCNQSESLAHLHHKLDLITQKLVAEEQEFEGLSFMTTDNYLASDEFRDVAQAQLDFMEKN